jgi:hypothetical protein
MIVTAVTIASSVLLVPASADAQVRVARPRASVVIRPAIRVRPRTTVFIGGYYYPSFYRASLYYGYPYGYPYYRYGGYYGAVSYQWPPYYGGGFVDLSGSARLQVSPRQTEVFIDGYYAGTVDDFDGVLQRLRLEPGEHELELYLAGYRPFVQRIYLQPGRTFRIRHVMEPLGPGEAAPVRPAGAPLPAPGTQGPRDPAAGPRAPYPGPRPAGADSRPAGFGELALRVQPADADVTIDGEKWERGSTDDRLVVQLGAGLHRLEIRKDGYRNYFTDVTVRNGDTTTLNVALTRQ